MTDHADLRAAAEAASLKWNDVRQMLAGNPHVIERTEPFVILADPQRILALLDELAAAETKGWNAAIEAALPTVGEMLMKTGAFMFTKEAANIGHAVHALKKASPDAP